MATIGMAELEDLAAGCDTVLAADPSPARIAIPFLHVPNAHPNNTARYAGYFAGKSPARTALRSFAEGIAVVAQSAIERDGLFSGDPIPDRADILFVSHLVGPRQAAEGGDLYFGDAPAELAAGGLRVCVALVNHVRAPTRSIRDAWRSTSVPRVLMNRTAGLRRELAWGSELSAAARALRAEANQSNGTIAGHAAAYAPSSGSRFSLRIAAQLGALVERLRPRVLVTTYEGHAWERLAFRRAREAMPAIACIGYHHTVLFPFPHAMTRLLGHGFDPDRIVSAGAVTRDWLASQPGLAGIPVDVLGSVRVPKGEGTPADRAKSRTCLVMPEGLMSECLRLANAAAVCAAAMPDLTFRIRLHPLQTPDLVTQAEPSLRSAPPNLQWSAGTSLEDDLANARWVLYRGTTAIVPAILAGLKPVYWAGGEPLSIDPLSALSTWRESADDAAAVDRISRADLATPDDERRHAFEEAAAYCRRYFMPFDADVLRRLAGA
jgi:hypothetical protein